MFYVLIHQIRFEVAGRGGGVVEVADEGGRWRRGGVKDNENINVQILNGIAKPLGMNKSKKQM